MLGPCTQLTAGRTAAAGVRGIHVLDCDPHGTGLVFDKALQLPERPAVQPCTHAPARPDTIADVSEILHHDLGHSDESGLLDKPLARFVVDVCDTSPLLAGDLPESLPCTRAAVGLETTTQGQMLIAPMAHCLPAPDPARAGGGERIFPHIHAHDRAGCYRFAVERLDGEIEKPPPLAAHQFPFLGSSALQELALVLPEDHRHPNAPLESVVRDCPDLERKGAV